MSLAPPWLRGGSGWNPPFRAPEQPSWSLLWPLLAAGFLLRLLLAHHTSWIQRPDEFTQYLEQAHRIVFGYGVVPWEYRLGVRNWMLSWPSIAALEAAKALGLDRPGSYATVVKAVHAAISMLIPLGMYHLARQAAGEHAGRIALILGLLWAELLVFAPRSLPESLSAAMLFGALTLARADARPARLAVAGFLMGLGIALRVAYAPVFGIAGLALLAAAGGAGRIALCAGGIAALLLWGAADFLAWGGWWESLLNYLDARAVFRENPPAGVARDTLGLVAIPLTLLATTTGLFFVAVGLALLRPRTHWLLLALLAAVVIPHSLIHLEFSNIFIATPLWLCLCAAVWALNIEPSIAAGRPRAWRASGALLFLALSILSALGASPVYYFFKRDLEPNFFVTSDELLAADVLSRIPADEMKGVALICDRRAPFFMRFGGYYSLHRDVPVYDAVRRLPPGRLGEAVSHVVGCAEQSVEGFVPVASAGGYSILANADPGRITPEPPDYFAYDLEYWRSVERHLLRRGILELKEVRLGDG